MGRAIVLMLVFGLITIAGHSQSDPAAKEAASAMFERITKSAAEFKVDTTAPPDDKVTRKIRELRELRGGFNINEAIDFKIEEDRQKNEASRAELDELSRFFTSGNGRRWLDNAVIWIYRNHFSNAEIKQLVKFYKTSAGQKMASDLPIIMLRSFIAADAIKGMHTKEHVPGR